MLGLTDAEYRTLASLSTPGKIQDYLDALPINHEKKEETCISPRMVLRQKKAHCLEGALLAAVALWIAGEKPLIMNLRTTDDDQDHAVVLFRRDGFWGALSKTNHAVLRYRDPVYRSPREIALSYFHEYFMYEGGKKTLRAYSKPVNVKRFGTAWITSEESVWKVAEALADAPHTTIVTKDQIRHLRPATRFERDMLEKAEWKRSDPRT